MASTPNDAGSVLPDGRTPLERAIEGIHLATAVYTAEPEVEALLDLIGWPKRGHALLDPAAGSGAIVVAAVARLDADVDDVEAVASRVAGYEFHPGACDAARRNLSAHLRGRGWGEQASRRAAAAIVRPRDFLVDGADAAFDVVVANPPYLRLAGIPTAYRPSFAASVPRHARRDLLHAFLDAIDRLVGDDGAIALITADRWLINAGAADLRASIGGRRRVVIARRLEATSAFHRPKGRTGGTPARVHPVALLLRAGEGARLDRAPFDVDGGREGDGTPLSEIATIRLAPWLGPRGIFIVDDPGDLPPDSLVPCYAPRDASPGREPRPGGWAILTDASEPPPAVLRHLDATLHAMPARGRRAVRWLPPETFHGRLPLDRDAVMVPRISRGLRTVRLPAGTMPVNHDLVVVSSRDAAELERMLADPRVVARADAAAARLDDGYRSYTATLLRALAIPDDLIGAR